MTSRELAARWGISQRTARRWLARGQAAPRPRPSMEALDRQHDQAVAAAPIVAAGGGAREVAATLGVTPQHAARIVAGVRRRWRGGWMDSDGMPW